jgi:predicted phage terminase large subunit-like protein
MLEGMRAERRRRQAEAERKRVAEDAEGIRLRCQTLAGFVREAWHVLEPNAVYVHNWHIDAICQHLEAVTDGRINRLLINVPPGSMKSLLVSVFWPAWEWSHKELASYRYIATAFSEDATKRDNRKMRDLVASDWYQALWPEVSLVRKGETSFANSATGFRESSPFGSLTSKRGDRLTIDDPHSIDTAESPHERQETTRRFREGALNRLNDQQRSAIVVVMQRLHERDTSGVILSLMGSEYVHLCLPMEFEVKRRCTTKIGFTDPRTVEGELLDPVRFPRQVVEDLKLDMGSHAYAGQYQQRPAAREGGMFKRHWFQFVDAVPADARKKVRRWDLAASLPEPGTDPDWTVGAKMSALDGKFYVEDVIRFRETGKTVRKAIKNTASTDGRLCHIVVPQDPGQAGKDQAASIIGENAGYRISAERESGDKGTRAEPFAAQLEAGNVYLLRAPWNETFIDELCGFPKGNDDQVDAAAGAFNHLAGVKGPMIISAELLARSAQPGPRR